MVARTSSMHDANATKSLPVNSTVAPRPLQNKLFGPGLEGSIVSRLRRGWWGKCPSWCWIPQQCVWDIYSQRCVFHVQDVHWGQDLNFSSHMQVYGHTDVLAPGHCKAEARGFLLQGLVKEKNTLYLHSTQDKTIQCQDVPWEGNLHPKLDCRIPQPQTLWPLPLD